LGTFHVLETRLELAIDIFARRQKCCSREFVRKLRAQELVPSTKRRAAPRLAIINIKGNRVKIKKAKFRVPKSVIVTTITVVVLLILLVGGGIAYVWYSGRNGYQSAAVQEEPAEKKPAKKERPPIDPKAPVGASVQSITSPVAPGENASITVHTTPEAVCTIAVEYNKEPVKDSGLIQRNADEYGVVTWTWTVDPAAPLGRWPAKVLCAHHEKSGAVEGNFEVKKPEAEEEVPAT
jgi:hypothetical protein